MLWWQIPYAIVLVVSVYAYPAYLLWTWPVEVEPDPRGREGLPVLYPVPLTLVRGGVFCHAEP